MMESFLKIFFLAAGASFIQRTTGFGFGIFIMTMLPFLMPSYVEATALSGLLALTTSAFISFRMRRFVSWKRLLPILAAFAIASAVSIFLLTRIEDRVLRKVLGVVLIFVSLYFAFFSKRIKLKTTLPYQFGAGTLSGIMGGLFGMQGPPAVLYFISSEPDKNRYMAMIQTYFAIGNLMMTAVRGYNGFITAAVGQYYVLGLAGLAIGTLSGGWAFKLIPAKVFPYIVYTYIGISGILILTT